MNRIIAIDLIPILCPLSESMAFTKPLRQADVRVRSRALRCIFFIFDDHWSALLAAIGEDVLPNDLTREQGLSDLAIELRTRWAKSKELLR
jgi:hypothetical protein